MSSTFKPPIAIHFIWHPSDNNTVLPILDLATSLFSRDIDRPFSRNLNVPIFLYCSDSTTTAPKSFPLELATKNIVFVFASVSTRGYDNWNDYICNIPISGSLALVPVALDREGLSHGESGSLKGLNFLRSYEWPESSFQQHSMLLMSHEIYRQGLVESEEGEVGKSSSIKLFLSHAKRGDTGLLLAEAMRSFIDNTNMSHFFDATDISPGFHFDQEIINHIKASTLIAIGSDAYSSRYWCQREILCAKEFQRPMITVDCLEEGEDRVFPAGSNIPCIHVSPGPKFADSEILRILLSALLETIRHFHAIKSLEYYKTMGWIDTNSALASRPPEIRQLLRLKEGGKVSKLCYPEPPIYLEESDWHDQLEIETFTPLWSKWEAETLKGWRVGISISDAQTVGRSNCTLPRSQITRLAQDLARHLLARSATLVYGGDLRKDGFTEFILDEAVALKSRLCTEEIFVENHLAWPLYLSDKKVLAWRARYREVMKTIEHNVPDDISVLVDKEKFIPPSTIENRYIWSRCLSEMRMLSIESSDIRICAGGKLSGYYGKMPGVLEEVLISLEVGKPIYLLGAFGGVVGEVCKVVRNEAFPETLSEQWQITHNAGYADLQDLAKSNGNRAVYDLIKSVLEGVDLDHIADMAGLDRESYLRLMNSPFVDECIHLIMQGSKKINF